MKEQDSLSAAWSAFEELSTRLSRYLETSEKEFVSLITALHDSWSIADNVQKATTLLAEHTRAASASQNALRQSLLEGFEVFRTFMNQIQGVSGELASTAKKTKELLGTTNQMQEILLPLKHVAFHFRLEGSRLSTEHEASMLKVYEEMRDVLGRMKQASDWQEHILVTILGNLSAATRSVELASASYASRASEAEERVRQNLSRLEEVPRDLLRVQNQASALGTVLAEGLRDAVQALQGHDAIRQRLEHILEALAGLRKDQGDEPEHTLLLQRQQAKGVRELIVNTGSSIARELDNVIDSAQGIAGEADTRTLGGDEVTKFENVVDRIASLGSEVAGLLAGDLQIGNFVLAQIDPVGELLKANRNELEALAVSMRSMKRLALNVLVSANKIPSARGIGVLGALTSEAAETVLKLERELNERFTKLSASLQSQADVILKNVQVVELCRRGLVALRPDDSFRNSRRTEYGEVARLSQEAGQLQTKIEVLVQSLKFVDEGTRLLEELDVTLNLLLALYPKSDKPFDLDAASAGYTMREQHEAHAAVGGKAEKVHGKLTEPAEGQDYGENVELF
jgi:hypothetical protein